MPNLNELKNLYEQGYRCIKTDNGDKNMTMYLKNFELECSKELTFDDEVEIKGVNEFLSTNKRM